MRVCWVQWVFLVLVGVLSVGQILTACGNKRPLYLPSEVSELAEKANNKDIEKKEKLKELLNQ